MFSEQFQWVCISMAPNAFSFPYNFYEGLRGRRSELETNSVGHDIYRHLVGAHDKMQPQTHPPEICRRKAILTFLAGECPGCLLELLWVAWFRDIISFHWQKNIIHFRTQSRLMRKCRGILVGEAEWRAPLAQVWGLTRFPGLAWVWSTCSYCSLCDYHSELETTVPQRRTQSELFREISLSQWKKKNKDSQQPAFAIWKVHAIA